MEFGSQDNENGSLITELFNHCLFYCSDEFPKLGDFHGEDDDISTFPLNYVKTKSDESRKAVY